MSGSATRSERLGRKGPSSRGGPVPGVPPLPGAITSSSGPVLREPEGRPAPLGHMQSIQDHHGLIEEKGCRVRGSRRPLG